MGIFRHKPTPAYLPPDLPTHNDPPRRGSVMDRMRSLSFSVSAEVPGESQHPTKIIGRKLSQAMVPAFARNASIAAAERNRNPIGLRLGETDIPEEDPLERTFQAVVAIDGEEDGKEKFAVAKRDLGRAAGDWQTTLGWELGPPRGLARGRSKRRSRKRAMRALDNDLDAFNAYAQNGLTSTTSRSLASSLNASLISLSTASGADTPRDDKRAVLVGDGYDALDVMADYIFRTGAQKKKWFKAPKMGDDMDHVGTGVTLRVKTGLYRTFPVDYEALDEFEDAIRCLNPEAAIKIKSKIVNSVMRSYM